MSWCTYLDIRYVVFISLLFSFRQFNIISDLGILLWLHINVLDLDFHLKGENLLWSLLMTFYFQRIFNLQKHCDIGTRSSHIPHSSSPLGSFLHPHGTLVTIMNQHQDLVIKWDCSPDTTERLHFHFSLSCIGEGNGNPLHCSCLENPRDGGAWWAAIYGVAQSDTTEVT